MDQIVRDILEEEPIIKFIDYGEPSSIHYGQTLSGQEVTFGQIVIFSSSILNVVSLIDFVTNSRRNRLRRSS